MPAKLTAERLALEDGTYANELLAVWSEAEEKLTEKSLVAKPLNKDIRALAKRFLEELVEHNLIPLSHGSLAQASLQLDMVLHFKLGEDQISRLPGACLSIATMAWKSDESNADLKHGGMARSTQYFAKKLRNRGFAIDQDILNLTFRKNDLWVLDALGWDLGVQPVEMWLNAYVCRFRLVTSPGLAPHLDWVLKRSTVFGRLLLEHVTSTQLLPSSSARALLAMGLVAASVLPYESLFPNNILDKAQFSECYGLPAGGPAPADKTVAKYVLDRLELVLGVSLQTLQAECLQCATAAWISHGEMLGGPGRVR
jgi:hypothetical protein